MQTLAVLRRTLAKIDWLTVFAVVLCGVFTLWVLWPLKANPGQLGTHDWDVMESHRYLVRKTILHYHQFPFWNPYGCGGHPAWAGIEADTIVVSPLLAAYLTLPLWIALRVEVVVMALFGVVGTWLFASRFTRSGALKAFAVVVFAINGRWALHLAAGHTWHLTYAFMPWIFFFVDRAMDSKRKPDRLRHYDVPLAGICFAGLVYGGGIYPLPQTAFAIVLYGIVMTISQRSLRPIAVVAAAGLIGIGLSLPKLMPMVDLMNRFPRLVESPEVFQYHTLVDALFRHDHQSEIQFYPPNQVDSWHEWGMYLGWPTCLALVIGLFEARGPRARALKWIGLLMFVISLGSFHELAPWTYLHTLPVFRSQHVPVRWMYPGLLMVVIVTVAAFEGLLVRFGRARFLGELVLLVAVAIIAHDVGRPPRETLAVTFIHPPVTEAEHFDSFRTERRLPIGIKYEEGAWHSTSLPATMMNFGILDCNTSHALSISQRKFGGKLEGLGAHAIGDFDYRGEVYVDEGRGTVSSVAFSPNELVVRVEGATQGSRLVLNQNWDAGWTVNNEPVVEHADLVTAEIKSSSQRFVFRYRPKNMTGPILGCVATCLLLVAFVVFMRLRDRRRARRRYSEAS